MKGTQIVIGRDEHQKAFFTGLSTFIDLINQQLSKEHSPEPLGNHIKVLGGYAFKSSEYKSEGIPVIRISDFQDEKIDLSNVQYYEENKEYDRYRLFEGDITIALTGGTIGKLGIVQKGLGKLYLNQRVGKFLVLHPKEFYDQYVYWLARGVQGKVKSFGYGGAQPNISGSQIEEILFPIPNKKIQEKIVEFLEDLRDNKIKNKEYFHKETEKSIINILVVIEGILTSQGLQDKNLSYITKLRQSILQEAVQGKLVQQNKQDEPASELLKKIKAEKEKLVREGKIKKQKPLAPISEEEKPYALPQGWGWVRLGDILELSEYGTSKKALEFGDVPVFGMGHIGNGKLNNRKTNYLSKHSEDLPRLYLKTNDLLFNRTNSYELVGKTALFLGDNNKFTFASYLIRLRFFNKILPEYANYYFMSSIFRSTQIEPEIIQQCGQANFNGTKLKETLFPLPPLPEQARIVEKVDKLMAYCDELEKQVKENQQNSEKLMGAVLKEAFSNTE